MCAYFSSCMFCLNFKNYNGKAITDVKVEANFFESTVGTSSGFQNKQTNKKKQKISNEEEVSIRQHISRVPLVLVQCLILNESYCHKTRYELSLIHI